MPSRLPSHLRSVVIQQWLQGKRRDQIAGGNGLSAGAVTNVIDEWRQALGFPLADALRELAITLERIGISAGQCATGFRIAMMMNRLGLREDNFESFMSDLYGRCSNLGLTSERIAFFLTHLLEFSKTVPISKIPDYIQQITREKNKLKEEIEDLKEQKEDLEIQKSTAEELLDIALENEKMTTAELKWYTNIKKELRRYRIPVDDVSQLAKTVNGIRDYGYDTQKALNELSNLELLKAECKGYQDSISKLQKHYDTLNQDCFFLQQMVSSHYQRLSIYNELEAMGYGLRELKFLRDTIHEIGTANNISFDQAVQKFFKDIEEQYDYKLGFETKIKELKAKIDSLAQEETRLRTQLLILPLVSPSLIRLLQRGVTEQDIVDIAELLKNDNAQSGSINIEEIKSLVSELRKYGNINSTINHLTMKVNKLRIQITSLLAERRNLDEQYQGMSVTLEYAKQLVFYFRGYYTSLSNEIMGLVSIMASIINTSNMEAEGFKKLQDDHFNKFAPLIRSARGEAVSVPELKTAMAKAVEVMLKELKGNVDDDNNNKRITKALSEAHLALTTGGPSEN